MAEKDNTPSFEAKSLPPVPVTARCASGYMLGNPCIPHYLVNVRLDVYHGDNVSGAENQQERLIEFRGWVIGFVDGEGCFSIGFVRQPNRPRRRGYTTGYQVSYRFTVTQGARSLHCLEELQSFFGVGRIFVNQRHGNHKEHLCQYVRGEAVGADGDGHTVLPEVPAPHLEAT